MVSGLFYAFPAVDTYTFRAAYIDRLSALYGTCNGNMWAVYHSYGNLILKISKLFHCYKSLG
ncbi:hypothetical protein HMPREF0663_10435 [Hoylesella oralis ATCC 33269]|uniref:Uncharacterized protein n=1 Tax=Hoylesella oralis ATCC 33269 TaxID=873533 RepID=E7RMT5_9BACT|nr:hypothetical protein HMPREF0663_10435 [Hoylesella oralis ATCC 33269]EPH16430.1 hypothetical protein HMPREF1475_01544 [Hoylesella oralis HGA0225]SHF39423.1 hypothetical protein SAMN05444288_0430 [Hoylesella oralis]